VVDGPANPAPDGDAVAATAASARALSDTLVTYRDLLGGPELVADLAARADVPEEWLRHRLGTSLEEAAQAIRFLTRHLRPGVQILEVGAGLGLTSAVLASSGFAVTSIEPGGEGFEEYRRLNPALRERLRLAHPHHEVTIQDITPGVLGSFDVVFSNNVLEHVHDVEDTLMRLDALLVPGGVMVHGCPNYTVPYEPHFGIPLVPVRPQWTARLLPSSIRDTGLWRSINFVTAQDVLRVAGRVGRMVELDEGILADAISRLRADAHFAGRHHMIARAAALLGFLDGPLRRLPPAVTTPMVFRWYRPR